MGRSRKGNAGSKRRLSGIVAFSTLVIVLVAVLVTSAQAAISPQSVPFSFFFGRTTTTTAPTSTTTGSSATTTTSGATTGAGYSAGTLYQETDKTLVFAGSWRSTVSRSYSGGSAVYASQSGASVTINFTGTSLTWFASTTSTSGKAQVTLDGAPVALIDLYSARTVYQQAVYSTPTLSNTSHTVTITSTASKNSHSTNTYVYFDAVGVNGMLQTAAAAAASVVTTTTTVAPTTTTTTATTTTTTTATAETTTTTAIAPTTTTTAAPAPTTTSTTVVSFDFKAAVDACPAGGTVTIPAGTWTISSQVNLKSNITVRGSGSSTVLVSSVTYPLVISGKSGIVLDSFALRGNLSTSAQAGISFDTAQSSNITIENLDISNMGFSGIFLSIGGSLVNSSISGCTVYNCGDFGIASRGVSSNVLIQNCVLHGFAGATQPPHGIYLHDAANLTVDGCEVYSLGLHNYGWSGLELDDCLNATVENCNMHDCKVGTATGGGFGYIAVGGTTIKFMDCKGSNNYYDFYEYDLTGSATYQGCNGTYVSA